ncbi:MAG: hypothetical protein L0215_09020 [Gemmataceae bacterium]|nr:hypothetical protein [Gemmataceae bacterium]
MQMLLHFGPSLLAEMLVLILAIANWRRNPGPAILAFLAAVIWLFADTGQLTLLLLLQLNVSGMQLVEMLSLLSSVLHGLAIGLLAVAVFFRRQTVPPRPQPTMNWPDAKN